MKSLSTFLIESRIDEGGAAGHMKHIIDYDDFTRDDLKELITNLFSGKVEDITEKIDGTNIQASMNDAGEVVFIRNKGDLNSERGGMSISDMAVKWADKPSVAETFVTAGEIISRVFEKVGKEFFNPRQGVRRVVNCECVIAGTTNIIPYASAQVDFHNIWVYAKGIVGEWKEIKVTKEGLDVINKACEGIDKAKITPNVVIDVAEKSTKLAEKYIQELDKIFDSNITIDEWKYNRFIKYLDAHDLEWVSQNKQNEQALYNRWFKADKSINIRLIKKAYPGHEEEITNIDKQIYKDITAVCIDPIDELFLRMGNDVIGLCRGLINSGDKDRVIKQLMHDLNQTVKDVNATGSATTKTKLAKQLKRLEKLGGSVNAAEGIVFNYKGRTMKLTGSFSPLNQILGSIKFSK